MSKKDINEQQDIEFAPESAGLYISYWLPKGCAGFLISQPHSLERELCGQMNEAIMDTINLLKNPNQPLTPTQHEIIYKALNIWIKIPEEFTNGKKRARSGDTLLNVDSAGQIIIATYINSLD